MSATEPLRHLRASTANKRPTPAAMADGQLALNTNNTSPGLFFKDSNGALVKVGPVHVGTTAPNASPAAGGSTGNALGEQWLDTTGGTYVFKVWDGSAWRSETGTFVDVNGDVMTGALGIIAGSAGSPGLYFSGDTNTGLYSPGADQVAISTGGSGRLFVDASGNVTVDYSSASVQSNFRVKTNSAGAVANAYFGIDATDYFRIYVTNGETWLRNPQNTPMAFHTNNTERLRITSAGLVGVGVSAPSSMLHVGGGGIFSTGTTAGNLVQVRNSDFSSLGYFGVEGPTGGVTLTGSLANATLISSGATGTPLQFGTGGTIRATLTSTGLGVGTTSPFTLFHVKQGANRNILFTDNASYANNGIVATNDSGSEVAIALGGNPIQFITGATERARIDSSGRLLVGTSSAFTNVYHATTATVQSPLQVRTATNDYNAGATFLNYSASGFAPVVTLGLSKSDTAGTNAIATSGSELGYLQFVGNDGTNFRTAAWITASVDGTSGTGDMPGRLVFSTTPDSGSSPVERLRIQANGRITLGGGAEATLGSVSVYPSYSTGSGTFVASTPLMYWNRPSDTNSGTACLFQNGGGTVGTITYTAASTAYNTSSDYRLKENITAVTDGISRLQQLKPSRFNFIADPGKAVDGFLAHEVQTVVPEAITGEKDAVDDDGNPVYQGIDQSKLVPLLTAALQEAVAKIENLESRLTAAGI